MRLKFFALGIVMVFIGLLLVAVSKSPVYTTKTDTVVIAEGGKDSFEISNITLSKGDRLKVVYSGGRYMNPEEIDVTVFDPTGNQTTFPYSGTIGPIGHGVIANSTGEYKIQLLGILIDPERPLVLTVQKVNEYTLTNYPNSDWLLVGLSMDIVGAGVSFWAAKSSKRKTTRSKRKSAQSRISQKS